LKNLKDHRTLTKPTKTFTIQRLKILWHFKFSQNEILGHILTLYGSEAAPLLAILVTIPIVRIKLRNY